MELVACLLNMRRDAEFGRAHCPEAGPPRGDAAGGTAGGGARERYAGGGGGSGLGGDDALHDLGAFGVFG